MNQTSSGQGEQEVAGSSARDDTAPAGMTQWKQDRIAEAVASYHRHLKPAKPMAAIRNLSPEFLDMAIMLDTLLGEFRDKYGRARLLLRYCERRGVPMEQHDHLSRKVPVPELDRIEKIGDRAYHAVAEMIGTIEKSKAIRYADRNLKKRASDLRFCPWFRQLDWLDILLDQDRAELR